MRLFYSPGASSLAPHIALREARLSADLVRVDLESATLSATGESFLALNPMGKVPALELADGSVLTEGAAVLEYIADCTPDAELAPKAGTLARHRLLEVLSFVATELHKGFSPMFDPLVPGAYKKRLMEDARPMQRMAALLQPGPYVLGDRFTIADAHFFAILRLGRHAGLDFSPWPHVDEYIERVAARPSVRAALEAEGLIEA